MEEIDDITLEQAKRGSNAAFRSLYAHYSPFVWRLCYRSSNGDVPSAEEILQDTFVKVHRYIGGFSRGSAFSTWLYKVAYHCVNDHYSKASRRNSRTLPFDDEYTEGLGTETPKPYEDRQLVLKILKPLNQTERFLLTAREVEGVSYEELAEIVGVTVGALRTRMARLKAEIRERLEKMDIDSSS
jgi:RNA polymerase sigma-70 factor (ECF subfamily)